MLMILAGAIFACLIGIIYLLWNHRTMQKELDNLHNTMVSVRHSMMPPLDEVIQHYEQKLGGEDQTEDEEDAQAEDGDGEDHDEAEEPTIQQVDLNGSHPEEQFDRNKFNSIRVKDLKEKCREFGFSPKGTKPELIQRLLKHPTFNNDDELVESMKELKPLEVIEEE